MPELYIVTPRDNSFGPSSYKPEIERIFTTRSQVDEFMLAYKWERSFGIWCLPFDAVYVVYDNKDGTIISQETLDYSEHAPADQ